MSSKLIIVLNVIFFFTYVTHLILIFSFLAFSKKHPDETPPPVKPLTKQEKLDKKVLFLFF